MFGSLKEKFLGLKDRLRDAQVEKAPEAGPEVKGKGKVTLRDKTRAFLKGEVVLDEKKLDDLLWDFQMSLLESDVALEVAEKISSDLKERLYGRKFGRREDLGEVVKESLRDSLKGILQAGPDLLEIMDKKPYVIAFVGVNGTGKTTTIAKVAHLLKSRGKSVVLAASDTFRAGAIEQLSIHGERLGVKVIKHEKGSDPAAVAYDAIEHAKARDKDVVLIDTAGRMETNVNLLDEMKKIVKVAKPDLILFVGDALTGNSAVDQAEKFMDAVHLDGIILTKADADARGGSAISIAHTIKKPVFFLGTGQEYGDLKRFDLDWFLGEILG